MTEGRPCFAPSNLFFSSSWAECEAALHRRVRSKVWTSDAAIKRWQLTLTRVKPPRVTRKRG